MITADISYADFVPGMFFFLGWPLGQLVPGFRTSLTQVSWPTKVIPNQVVCEVLLEKEAWLPGLIGVSTLNYWLWNSHLLQEFGWYFCET